MTQSHKHHYVPEWYQRRFMLDGKNSYFRLDLSPETIRTPAGRIIKKGEVLSKGPNKFFYETDLYTTKYFNIENDEVIPPSSVALGCRGLRVNFCWAEKLTRQYRLDGFTYCRAQ